jgi:hypothetical protein
MYKKLLIAAFIFSTGYVQAQQYRFYPSNGIKFLKQNNDSLKMPFTGGFNAPQFSNIDLNNDGTNDLFVFNRGSNKATLFLKTSDGYRHAYELEGKFPPANDWCLLRDFDGDGKKDIFTEVTMDRRFLRDTIQHVSINGMRVYRNKSSSAGLNFVLLNNQLMDTGGFYVDFGLPKPIDRVGANLGDIPCIDDLDGDGDADILSFQQLDLSPYYYENFVKNKYNIQYKTDSTRFIHRDECWGFMQYDANSLRNRFNLGLDKSQLGACMFQMYEKHARHAATTFTMLDYNGDGVQDLIYGDGVFKNLLLLTNGRNLNSRGRDSIIAQDTAFPSNTVPAQFIKFPAAYYVDYDADGKRDLIVTTNDHISEKSVNNVWRYTNTGTDAKPVFQYVGNDFFGYSETIDHGTRSVPALVDIDADGDQDLLVATNGDYAQTQNLNDRLVLYTNTPENGRAVFKLTDTNFLALSTPTPILNIHPAFADLDGDGKPDMIIGQQDGTLLFYKNNSSGTNYAFQPVSGIVDGIDAGSTAAPTIADLNKDGKPDIIIGNRDGLLKLYLNKGSATAPLYSPTPDIDTLGKIDARYCFNTTYNIISCEFYGFAVPYAYDLDADGNVELIVANDAGYVAIYTGVDTTAGKIFTKLENVFVNYGNGQEPSHQRFGRRASVCVGLLDADNKPDLLVGNIAGGLQYFGSVNPLPNTSLNSLGGRVPFTVYPNPANSTMTIQHGTINATNRYELYDMDGRLLLSGDINPYYSETSVDVSNLMNGLYFLRIGSNVVKVMISK